MCNESNTDEVSGSCCTSSNLCGLNEGDCDDSSHCLPGLTCLNTSDNPVGGGIFQDQTKDVCYGNDQMPGK